MTTVSSVPVKPKRAVPLLGSAGASMIWVFGDVQGSNALRSSEHSNVTPGSVAPKLKLALGLVLTVCGAEEMNVSGGAASPSTIRQVWEADSGSTLPAASVAR